jgi:hypothetical protein
MPTTTLNIPANRGKTGIKTALAAQDANNAALLASNVASVGLALSDEADGTAILSLALKDANNVTIAARGLIRLWISGTSYGAPNAGAGQTAFAVTGGTEINQVTDLADYRILTAATGLAEVTLTGADATYHVMAECNGLVSTGSVAITGN